MPVGLRPHLLRLYRLAVLAGVVWVMHAQHQWLRSQRVASLTIPDARRFFPTATDLGPRTPPHDTQTVRDATDQILGFVLHTSPETDALRGYSGPSDVLIALDPTGRIVGTALLSSEDTADHTNAVVEDTEFWRGFHGLALGSPARPKVDAVSGSTLTSDAITRSVIQRLGGTPAGSSLFPTEILLAEVRMLLPPAASMHPHPTWPGVQIITDQMGRVCAHALRTSPSQDSLPGYQGPSDTLILLDATAQTVLALHLRKSFDNEEYYERMLAEERYLGQFKGWTVEKVAGLDLKEAGIEGVSGATHTSWAVVEAARRRLGGFLADRERPANAFPIAPRQIGLLLLTLGGILMSFTKLRGQPLLRIAWQIVLVVYLGLLSGDLLSQALLAGWAQSGIAWRTSLGMLGLAAAAFLIPWTTGHQLYCHHLCPHGALQQWLGRLPIPNIKVPAKLHKILSLAPALLLFLVIGNVLLGLGLNNAALEAFDAYLFRVAGWASISLAAGGLLASLFIPLAYCKYGCPTGLLLKFLRSRGAGDTFGRRDWVAGTVLAAALAVLLLH